MLDVAGAHSTESLRAVDLSRKGSHSHAHFVGELNSQVPKTPDTNDCTSYSSLPVTLEGCIYSDACT